MNAEPQARPRLLRRTLLLGSLTFVSRLLGFVRESVMAALLGAGAAADAFFVAFRLPNMVRQLLADGVAQPAIVPMLLPIRDDAVAFRALLGRLLLSVAAALLLLTALAWLAAPLLSLLQAPGYADDPVQWVLATELLRITLPYVLLAGTGAVLVAALFVHERDAAAGLWPLLPNLALIAVPLALAGGGWTSTHDAATALLLGGFLQLLLPLYSCWRLRLLGRPRAHWQDPQLRQFLSLLWPSLLSGAVLQGNALVSTLLASFLGEGSISWLYLADRLLQFPQGIIGGALAAVLLHQLGLALARGDTSRNDAIVAWATRLCWWLALPITLALLLLAEPLAWTVFGYGQFTANDVRMCAAAAAAMGLGLPAFLLARVRASALYAARDHRTPLCAALASLAVNGLLGTVAVICLDGPGSLVAPHAGIALAMAAACWVQWWWLGRRLPRPPRKELRAWLLPGLVASSVLAALWSWWPSVLPEWAGLKALSRFLQTGVVLLGGVLLYGLLLRAGGVRIRDWRGPA